MFCTVCGNNLPENAKFCAKCGTPVKPISPMPMEETVVVSRAPEAPLTSPIVPANPTIASSVASPDPKPATPKKGGNGKKVALVITAFILTIALLFVAAVFIFDIDLGFNQDDDDDDDDRKSSSTEDADKGGHSTPIIGDQIDNGESEGTDNTEQEDEQESATEQGPSVEQKPSEEQESDTEQGPSIEQRPSEEQDSTGEEGTAVDQKPTEEQVMGMTSDNPYYEVYSKYDDFVLLDSDKQVYKTTVLAELSFEELMVARQEIYARHGQVASDNALQAYFDEQEWYQPAGGTLELNDYEKANIYIINCILVDAGADFVPQTDNPYLSYLFSHEGIVLGISGEMQLTARDLADLTETELVLAEAEILARYGYFPSDPHLLIYFRCNPWFSDDSSTEPFSEELLNDYEKTNLPLIRLYLQKARGITYTSTNPFKAVDDAYDDYVIPYSSTQTLTDADYKHMTLPVLCIARNEILARHGYTFTDSELSEYFLSQDWYHPNGDPGNTSNLGLSALENENVMAIKEYENYLKGLGYSY